MNAISTTADGDTALALPGADTARELAAASIAPNTMRAYATTLGALDDGTLAAYVGHVFEQGRSRSTAAITVAAARFRARVAEAPSPAGPRTERALAGFRRRDEGRGRGQAAAMLADDIAAIVATACAPRKKGCGMEAGRVKKTGEPSCRSRRPTFATD